MTALPPLHPRAGPAAAELREWALRQGVLESLRATLPAYPGEGARHDPGLYIEARDAPGSNTGGELRLSVLRLHTVDASGKAYLVAQVHATAWTGATESTRRLRFYVHDVEGITLREEARVDAWWVTVLDRHYELGGGLVPGAPIRR